MKHIKNFKTVDGAANLTMMSPAVKLVVDKFEAADLGDGVEIKIDENGDFILPVSVPYLCFTADGEDSTISLANGEDNAPVIYYSFDLNDWTLWDYEELPLSNGLSVYMYGDNTAGFSHSDEKFSSFVMSGKIAASGNILSLISKDMPNSIPCDCCYNYMFSWCESLTQAPTLPATTLADYCYANMFERCSNLTQAPELPATTLALSCYAHMFLNCSSLTQAPALPATTLEYGCYLSMFKNCSGLTKAPALPATTLEGSCYVYMFEGCSSLTQAPELPATTLVTYCYERMFLNCSSLTQAPELPATTLAWGCYRNMFRSCSNLAEVTTYATSWDTSNTIDWLSGVSSTGTFYNLGNTYISSGADGIPNGWTEKTSK